LLLATLVLAQQVPDSEVLHDLSGATTYPRLSQKEAPEYPKSAGESGKQGSVLLSIVVDRNGILRNIEVLSPLGFGLDESAATAVSHPRFIPGMKGARGSMFGRQSKCSSG